MIHGYKTIFPIPLGLAATWDLGMIEKSARIAAIEASAGGICWTYSPMVDIARDPRWGRVAEGAGEEVVQMYISDPVATVSRAIKELKGFTKISLNPEESKVVLLIWE